MEHHIYEEGRILLENKRICRGGHNDDHHDDDKGVADIDVNDVNADADISMMSMMMMMTE